MVKEKRKRKTIDEIKENILEFLKLGPKAEKEIAEKIESNWATTSKVMNELKEEGKILEVSANSRARYYRRSDDPVFYSLPFSERIRKQTLSLMKDISDTWKKETGESIPKTSLQKIAVQIVKENPNKFDLPIMKFHYGQVVSLRYDEVIGQEYEVLPLTKSQHEVVLKYVNKNKKKKSYVLVNEQYKQKGMEFFKVKNELIEMFKEEAKKIDYKIIELSAYFPPELEETLKLYDRFEYLSINLLNIKDIEEYKIYKESIESLFRLLWDVITTEYFFLGAKEFIDEEKKELFNSIKSSTMNTKISNVLPIIEDLVSEAESKEDSEINMKTSNKSKELLHDLIKDLY